MTLPTPKFVFEEYKRTEFRVMRVARVVSFHSIIIIGLTRNVTHMCVTKEPYPPVIKIKAFFAEQSGQAECSIYIIHNYRKTCLSVLSINTL